MAKEYADAFCATYEDPSGFLEFLRERNRRTQWRRAPAPELRYAVLEEGDEIDGPHGDYTDVEWQEIAEDTRLNNNFAKSQPFIKTTGKEASSRKEAQVG